ncbi:hypothetical protein [Clostridium sp. KNHs214]|uniref:hypothetical protein n=1 Tax=Clostridium sp. KNHs214 TaxID=1540257 RepID=UPI000A4DFBE4|nr:hypothetical protein [Clostridium sp. KNHs214]
MKKIMNTIVLTLSLIVLLNGGSRIVSAKPIENQSKYLVNAKSISSCIDPEPTGK